MADLRPATRGSLERRYVAGLSPATREALRYNAALCPL